MVVYRVTFPAGGLPKIRTATFDPLTGRLKERGGGGYRRVLPQTRPGPIETLYESSRAVPWHSTRHAAINAATRGTELRLAAAEAEVDAAHVALSKLAEMRIYA